MEADLLKIGARRVVFRAVDFLFGLGWEEEIKGDPCSVEDDSASLTGDLSAKEPVSLIKIGSCSEGFIGLEVLYEAI